VEIDVAQSMSEIGRLVSVLVKHARDAFVDESTIASQWQALNFTAPPAFAAAAKESDRLIDLLQSAGATVHLLAADAATTLDSIYARDASLMTPHGIVLGRMGKAARGTEPAAQERAFAASGIDAPIVGRIEPPGTVEGGDIVWLDATTLVVGRGYRTNADGIRQLRALAGAGVDVVEVPLPHWRGQGDVMHLMSIISPVDRDLAVVFSPLMPVPFRELLLERGYRLVEVPDDEFESMGCNVLALAPRRCLMLAGNTRTRAALERAGAEVIEYAGTEISLKGGGGPTCLTRPLVRLTIE
jgi:N-dimethylarginine dimethylaminohydrolase